MMKTLKRFTAICFVAFLMFSMLSLSVCAVSKPSKPTGLKAASVSSDKVSLTWNKSKGADGYQVYVKRDNKWKKLKSPSANKCDISGLVASETYTFAVRSVKKSGGKNYLSDSYATVKVKTKALKAPKLTASAGADYATLKWKKVPGATGYNIYQKSGDSWKKVKTLSSKELSCDIKQLKPNTSYQFNIRAVTSAGGKNTTGPKSSNLKIKTLKANKVKAKITADTSNSVSVSWSKVKDASGYCVYSYVDGKWVGVKTLNSRDTLKTVVTSLKSDSKYRLRVRAFKNSPEGKLWFVAGDELVATTDPTSKNLTLKRTKQLSKILNGKSFTLCYETENKDYGEVPVKIYKSGNKYRLDSKVNEISYSLINSTKVDYVLLTGKKRYVKVPSLLSGSVDIKSAVDDLLPEKDWNGKAILAEFEGEKVVCEIYTDILKTKSVRYYYRAGELVGIEQYNSSGRVVEKAVVTTLKQSAGSSLFKVPGGYKEIK